MPPQKVIIDTDPGVDDILALLLALSSSADELQVLLISLTFGNIDIQNVLRNTVAMFHVLELEREWRAKNGKKLGYETLAVHPPIVAVGAEGPLEGELLMADYFRVHTTAPHFTPQDSWAHLFDREAQLEAGETRKRHVPKNFRPSSLPAHREMLRVLREEEEGTVTIVAVGPLTNLALAAEEDLGTFLRAKEVVVMGGTIDLEGNCTPVAEFNHYACAYSAARIYALTSPNPQFTLPPSRSGFTLPPFPSTKRLNLVLFPLDITTMHLLPQITFSDAATPLGEAGSPLANWCSHFLAATYRKMEELHKDSAGGRRVQDVHLSLHDPMCIYYVLTRDDPGWRWRRGRDVRVDATGQWTRGMCVVDRRTRRSVGKEEELVVGDVDRWLHAGWGNRVQQVVGSPEGTEGALGGWLVWRVFGC
ncbi:Inosine/uridine-preferring nucleoside hydrolase domain-containing protein [Terfezia claveryi]|nr:Inosine/uridine-preferring nucleoside hydrolase domain-containing protein [Terfezia claveryi]